MLVLTIDTSTPAVTAGLVEVDAHRTAVVTEHVDINARGHGELLAPAIECVLATAFVTPSQVQAVVAGTGPGPYTGLRVGLVTAAVLGLTLGIPTYGVCSLDAIAAVHADAPDLLVATDARRKEIYWARYAAGQRVDGPAVDRPADVARSAVVVGTDLYDLADAPSYPTPLGLALAARHTVLSGAPSEVLTPLYLRHPDAVAPGAPKAVTP